MFYCTHILISKNIQNYFELSGSSIPTFWSMGGSGDWPEVSDLMTGVTWSTHDIQHRSFAFLRCFFLAKLDIIDITISTTFHPSVHKNQSLIYDMIWPTNRALSHNWEKSCHQRFTTPKMPMHNIPKVQIHSTKDAIHRRCSASIKCCNKYINFDVHFVSCIFGVMHPCSNASLV